MTDSKGIPNLPPLPWEQHEHPGKRRLDDVRLHTRREAVSGLLMGAFLLAGLLLPALGWGRTVQWNLALPGLGWELPALPIGVLLLPLGFFCIQMLAELLGTRRAIFSVILMLMLQSAVIGLRGLTEGTEVWNEGAGLLAFFGVAHAAGLVAYSLLARLTGGQKLWLRQLGGTGLGQLAGTAAMVLVWSQTFHIDPGSLGLSVLAAYVLLVASEFLATMLCYLLVPPLTVFLRLMPRGAEPFPASSFETFESFPSAVPR